MRGCRVKTATMMTETQYHQLADKTLEAIAAALESADESGDIEVDLEGAVLTIGLPSSKQYLVSKHAPSQQLWVSSPVSGGLHFSYDKVTDSWHLPDGRHLHSLMATELETLAGIEMVWS